MQIPIYSFEAPMDPMDFNDSTSAERIGNRIREIRVAKGLTQAKLNELVGLGADRIQKYENGVRKPKPDLLKKIADALGVSTLALVDPVVSNYQGAMHAFFEMESKYGMTVHADEAGNVFLEINRTAPKSRALAENLSAWVEEQKQIENQLASALTDEEKKAIQLEYSNWKWNYPEALADKTHEKLKELRRAQIQEQIDKLEKEKRALDS